MSADHLSQHALIFFFFLSLFTWKEKCFQQQNNILSTRLAIFRFKVCFHISIFLPFDMFSCRKKEAAGAVEEKGSYQRTQLLKNSAMEREGIMVLILVASSSESLRSCALWKAMSSHQLPPWYLQQEKIRSVKIRKKRGRDIL